MGEQTAANVWARILAITASTAGALAVGAGALLLDAALDRITTIEGIVHGMAVSVAELRAEHDDHLGDAGYWKDRIEQCRANVAEIRTNAMARKDPFTGTQGRALERRIDACERGISTLVALAKRVDEIKATNDAERTYYRANIVPMIQQIQMQLQKGMQP